MKNIFKILLAVILTAIIVGSLSVYATYNYFATDVTYKKADGSETTVDLALDELYRNIQNGSGNNTDNIFDQIDWTVIKNKLVSTRAASNSVSLTLPAGNYIVFSVHNYTTANGTIRTTTFDETTTPTLTVPTENGTCELITGYEGLKDPTQKIGTFYVGMRSNQKIYKCNLNKETTLTETSTVSDYAQAVEIMTMYAIKID